MLYCFIMCRIIIKFSYLILSYTRVPVVSDVRERIRDLGSPLRFMLRRSSLVECVTRNVFTMRRNFFYPSVCAAMFVKKS